jgi:hypothetical protein
MRQFLLSLVLLSPLSSACVDFGSETVEPAVAQTARASEVTECERNQGSCTTASQCSDGSRAVSYSCGESGPPPYAPNCCLPNHIQGPYPN